MMGRSSRPFRPRAVFRRFRDRCRRREAMPERRRRRRRQPTTEDRPPPPVRHRRRRTRKHNEAPMIRDAPRFFAAMTSSSDSHYCDFPPTRIWIVSSGSCYSGRCCFSLLLLLGCCRRRRHSPKEIVLPLLRRYCRLLPRLPCRRWRWHCRCRLLPRRRSSPVRSSRAHPLFRNVDWYCHHHYCY